MKKPIITGLLVTLFLVTAQPLFGNYAFYRSVINTCKAYRVNVSESDMSLSADVQGVKSFHLNLTSMRNNFEMVLLVGFVSAGEAIRHQRNLAERMARNGKPYPGEIPAQVIISVVVPTTRDNMVVTARAKTEQVEQLTNGTLNSADFMRQIKDTIQTL